MGKAKWPSVWAMTDERMGDGLLSALERLPTGGGIVFRHYTSAERAALAQDVAILARQRNLTLAIAGDVALAKAVKADLVHNPDAPTAGIPFSLAVHSSAEAAKANHRQASLAFVSPIFATRSHLGASTLSRREAGKIVQALRCPAIALGGVNADNYPTLDGLGFQGWAGIDAWLRI